MRISDYILKSKIYLITHDRVSEVHCHVSQNILKVESWTVADAESYLHERNFLKNFSLA